MKVHKTQIPESVISDVVDQLKEKYPQITKEMVIKVINYQFMFVRNRMAERDYKPIFLKNFGIFRPRPQNLKYLQEYNELI